ncbi:hypothetical protein C8Q74DRAFT_1370205 [Fomes fomentarius]|nr:hypothetical protein C8Q74DRAFT_1370205 [Fomes fomentarius]
MSRPNSPRPGNPSPRPVNAGDVQGNQPRIIRPMIGYTVAPKNSTCLELPKAQSADVAPPRVLKTQSTHVDQAARAVYNALASVTLAHELEDGVLPLSALLWDGEWSKDKVFVANAMYAWEKAQEKEIGSVDQEAATAKRRSFTGF